MTDYSHIIYYNEVFIKLKQVPESTYLSLYPLLGIYRAFFTFHIEIVNDTVFFRYLVPRGEAYGKKTQVELKRMDE